MKSYGITKCEICKKTIIKRTPNKRFCSKCRIIHDKEHKKEYLKIPKNYINFRNNLSKWRNNNPEKVKKYNKKWRSKNKDKIIERQKRYIKKHPQVIKAHNLSQTIKKDSSCFCCKSKEALERHHPDYSKPREIITLCKRCHTKVHNPQMEVINL